MGTYKIILTVVFLILFVIFVLRGAKACVQAAKATDNNERKNFRRKALFLMVFGLMFFLCALYVIFRISWFMLIVFIIGTSAVAYVTGSGVAANMHKH